MQSAFLDGLAPPAGAGRQLNIGLNEIVCPLRVPTIFPALFIAGGISNCPDWQATFCALLNECLSAAEVSMQAFNPRRPNFPIGDPSASQQQISWEYDYLSASSAVSFWFPKDTVCPITLYELGVQLAGHKPLFLGIDPQYKLRTEIIAIAKLHRPDLVVVDDLSGLADQVVGWATNPPLTAVLPMLPALRMRSSLFIAGGISNCPDWQSVFTEQIRGETSLSCHNPRRADFVRGKDDEYAAQLAANHKHFLQSDAVSIWFPKDSINPFVLLELGIASGLGKKIFVGVEPEYFRALDVEIQTALKRPEVEVVKSLAELFDQIKQWSLGS